MFFLIGSVLNIATAAAMWYSAFPFTLSGIASGAEDTLHEEWESKNRDARSRSFTEGTEEGPWIMVPPWEPLEADGPERAIDPPWPEKQSLSYWTIAVGFGEIGGGSGRVRAGESPRGMQRLAWVGATHSFGRVNAGGVMIYAQAFHQMKEGERHQLNESSMVEAVAFGWPFIAFQRGLASKLTMVPNVNWSKSRRFETFHMDAFGWSKSARWLPPAPIWRGLALNTLILGAVGTPIWLGLVAFASAMRRHLRRDRNLCPHCGYPREGLASLEAPCPECGKVSGVPSDRVSSA